MKKIEPQWILLSNDTLHHVSVFDHLDPRQRPLAFCPLCGQTVILKLGTKRTHHYAHYAPNLCAAQHPETALHLNTKHYLAHCLDSATELHIQLPCSRCRKPTAMLAWKNWHTVAVEYQLDPMRPDIVLLNNGVPVGAIEVRVHHAVTREKEQWFLKNRLPWIELLANETLYSGVDPWTPDRALPVVATSFHGMCDRCATRQQKTSPLSGRYVYQHIHAIKVIDRYRRSQYKGRQIILVVQAYLPNGTQHSYLLLNTTILGYVPADFNEMISEQFSRYVRSMLLQAQHDGFRIVIKMPWQRVRDPLRTLTRIRQLLPLRPVDDYLSMLLKSMHDANMR